MISAVVVDDWLYIDGGELYAIENDNPTFFYRKYEPCVVVTPLSQGTARRSLAPIYFLRLVSLLSWIS